MARYPLLSQLLTAEFERLRKSGGEVRFRQVSKILDISPATLNSWKQGRTFPNEKLDEIAGLLYPEGGVAQKTFKERLLKAKRTSDVVAIRDLPERELTVSYLEFAPFCRHPGQQPAGFCDAVFSRFLRLGRFRTVAQLRTGAEDAVESVRTSMSEISVCLFDSIPRSADLIAFHSPCRVSINGICLERNPEKLDVIRKALTLGSGGAPAPSMADVLTPFGVYNEVGFCYLRDTIGLDGPDLIQTVDSLTPECFAAALLSADPRKPTAVIVADEITILKTIAVLAAKDGNSGRTSLVFPLTTQRAAERHKRQLPGHIVSLTTVGTKQRQLADYLQKSLNLLLQTESELISDLYLHLYYALRDLVKESISCLDKEGLERLQTLQDEPAQNPALWASACADRVARYALRLNQGDVISAVAASQLPWFHIIEVVKKRIGPPQEGTEHPDLGRIRIACRPFPLFCEVPQLNQDNRAIENYGFLGQLLKPLRQFINTDQIDVVRDARRIRAIEEPGWPDVRIGLFATLDRSRHWKHLELPCSVPLNAVVRMTDREDWDALRTKMRNSLSANPAKSQRWRAGVRPVVLYLGSGFEYVVNTLGYDLAVHDGVVTVQELDCALYAQQLIEQAPDETRVAVVDILTCLQILNERSLVADARLVFPLQPTEGLRLPSYRVGIAVNKDAKEWIDFFEDAYPRLLETNVDWIAHCYALLFEDLVKFLRQHCDRLTQQNGASAADFTDANDDVIRQWTKTCLGLDRIESIPDDQRLWKPILTAANEFISKREV